eukprot:gnl/TRDRNA2_/TRDRNA2_137363_c0_seq1.p1 gnl/TRDRNA2_/TRDRNA2_137363_c0~~gnl/TRDRNA2_/TRDRNA2_137363_c0_seq1.p1  ORF type:complete len:356 (-),score=11.12 gnl/TRDRNA2_/TRDRNA2_137363_c0_seq1:80-1147(-)
MEDWLPLHVCGACCRTLARVALVFSEIVPFRGVWTSSILHLWCQSHDAQVRSLIGADLTDTTLAKFKNLQIPCFPPTCKVPPSCLTSSPVGLARLPPRAGSRSIFTSIRPCRSGPIRAGTEAKQSDAAGPTKSQRPKRQRRIWHRISTAVALDPPKSFTIHEGKKVPQTFVHVHGLLDEDMVRTIHDCFGHPSVFPCEDRGIKHEHEAFRIERALQSQAPALYKRLYGLMRWADATLWKSLKRLNPYYYSLLLYPEFEYIVYDARNGTHGFVEPHVDNESAVTMIILLSDPKDFEGGVNCFASTGTTDFRKKHPPRCLYLQKGDAVVFRGERLPHWITPVTGGVRIILQIELSKV